MVSSILLSRQIQPRYSWEKGTCMDKYMQRQLWKCYFPNVGGGVLHICFNFLKAIGQPVESSRLDKVWIEYGVVAQNTTEPVLEGNADYRAVGGIC